MAHLDEGDELLPIDVEYKGYFIFIHHDYNPWRAGFEWAVLSKEGLELGSNLALTIDEAVSSAKTIVNQIGAD